MAITAYQELVTGNLDGITVPYYVHEDTPGATLSRSAAQIAAVNQFLLDFPGLSVTLPSPSFEDITVHSIRVICEYSPKKLEDLTPQAEGEIEYGFNFRAPVEEFYYSLSTPSKSTGAPDWGNMINVQNEGTRFSFQGVRISPNETDYVQFVVPLSDLSQNFRNTVQALMGKVNSTPFGGRPAGSVRFVTGRSRLQTDDKVSVYYGFEEKPNRIDVDMGNSVTLPFNDGHDYAWKFTQRDVHEPGGGGVPHITVTTLWAYSERIFERANLNLLLS